MITKEEEELKERGHVEDMSLEEATFDTILAKWESVEPFHFEEAKESEPTEVAHGGNLVAVCLAKGLLLFNILKESFVHPNKTTVIAKKTGKIIQ